MSFRHLLVLFFVVATLVSTRVFVASAQTSGVGGNQAEIDALNKEIEARKTKIKELEETMAKYQSNIKQKQTEAQSLKNQIAILDNRVGQLNTDIEITGEKIAQTELEIRELTLAVHDKEKSIAKQKRIIDQMIKNISENDQKNYIEIMLTYKNFSEFYNEIKATENVYVDLGRSVKSLRLAKEDLSAREAETSKKREALAQFKKQLEDKKSDLAQQMSTKSVILTQTKSSEARYQTLLQSLKQQNQAIESEIRSFENTIKKKLEEQNKIQSSGPIDAGWPVPSRHINAYFHDTDYPYKKVFEHSGIDIRAAHGTAVRAVADGYVGRARRCTSSTCYSYVLLIHTSAISSLYGHLSRIAVPDDGFVRKGEIIGYSGGTPGTVGAGPFVTGPHLHFEIRLNGIPVNPLGYVTP